MKISKHARGNYYTTFRGKFIYGATPEEVEEKYDELKYQYRQGYNVDKNPTLEDYMILWYNTHKKGQGALKTQEMYRNCVNNHINPVLGHKRLKEITATQVQALLNSITSSRSLAHKVRITLNQIFKQAIADRLVNFNPVQACKVIAPDKPKREFLSGAQREKLLEILKGNRLYPLIYTMLYTGMRQGEALALTWSDIDFENKRIIVSKAIEYEKSKSKTKDPKTERGFRQIPIPEELVEYLQEYKKKTKSIYVFPGHAGGLIGLTELNNHWRKAKRKIAKWFEANPDTDIGPFNLTCRLLRHTYCTGLFDAGIDEVSAAEIMGHDVSIMREVYTHISDERKKATVEKIETLYKSKKRSKRVQKL
jgi:integrase